MLGNICCLCFHFYLFGSVITFQHHCMHLPMLFYSICRWQYHNLYMLHEKYISNGSLLVTILSWRGLTLTVLPHFQFYALPLYCILQRFKFIGCIKYFKAYVCFTYWCLFVLFFFSFFFVSGLFFIKKKLKTKVLIKQLQEPSLIIITKSIANTCMLS